MSKNGTRQNECMELDRIFEAMKRIMAENSRVGTHIGIQSAQGQLWVT
jgi:hypothetical protein